MMGVGREEGERGTGEEKKFIRKWTRMDANNYKIIIKLSVHSRNSRTLFVGGGQWRGPVTERVEVSGERGERNADFHRLGAIISVIFIGEGAFPDNTQITRIPLAVAAPAHVVPMALATSPAFAQGVYFDGGLEAGIMTVKIDGIDYGACLKTCLDF
jgi:hypothetical protein